MLQKDKTARLSYRFYFIPTLIIAVLGAVNSLYLAYTHYKNYTDIGYVSFCAISRTVNCDTVSQSPWSIFWNVPLALWGFLGYLLFIVLLLPTRTDSPISRPLWSLLFLTALCFSSVALVLGYISSIKINSYCILCILSYTISFALLLYTWIVRRRFNHGPLWVNIKKSAACIKENSVLQISLACLFLLAVGYKTFLPHYWLFEFASADKTLVASGISEEGNPWIGARDPQLIIEELSDYQCFQCYKAHFALRKIVEQYPEKIRLIHRHYPLDHEFNPVVTPQPFHVGSGRLALMAIAAAKQNKFWEVNDYIFQELRRKRSAFDLEVVAKHVGLDFEKLNKDFVSQSSHQILEEDIKKGLRHNMTSTPSFLVNGKFYHGMLPLGQDDIAILQD